VAAARWRDSACCARRARPTLLEALVDTLEPALPPTLMEPFPVPMLPLGDDAGQGPSAFAAPHSSHRCG